MSKRSIQTTRAGYTVGIEHDHQTIRCARVSADGRGGFSVERLEEAKGDFSAEAGLLEGYRAIKNAVGIGARDAVVACLSGKQVYASELEFRKLAEEEMEQALRLELRKIVHFEIATATLDFEILEEDGSDTGSMAKILVALAANSLLNREMNLLARAGIKAAAFDVLPVGVANALWAYRGGKEGEAPLVGLHLGPQTSTIVIDSEHFPFFNRTIPFAAEEIFGPNAASHDVEKRIQSLTEEVTRSVLYYEKNYHASGFQEIHLLGDYLEGDLLAERLRRASGLAARKMDLPGALGSVREPVPGRFDLAVALALQGDLR